MIVQHYLELLHYYRKLLIAIVVGITTAVAGVSWLWLSTFPLYTATADVTILPTDAELSFTKGFLTGSQYNPANVMTQTQIEYLLSRPVAEKALELVAAQGSGESEPPPTGFKQALSAGAKATLQTIRKIYNILNSGKHVPLSPYEDAVETLMDSITLEVVEGSYVLEISVTLPKRSAVAVAANSLAEAYVRKVQEDTAASSAEMTKFLEGEISKRVDMLSRVSDREAGMLQAEIAATRDRLAGVQMAKASVLSQIRIINPAVTPIYPTYPKIVIYTLIGLGASLVIAAFVIVFLDTVSDTIKTLTDLRRLVGERALGRLGPSVIQWARSGFKPWSKRGSETLKNFAEGAVARMVTLNALTQPRIQVTGFGKRDEVAAVSVAVAAAFAHAGRNVLCDRRGGEPANENAGGDRRAGNSSVALQMLAEKGSASGTLVLGFPVDDGSMVLDNAIVCHGPIGAEFQWDHLSGAGAVVVCIPSGGVTEGMVQEFRSEAERKGLGSVFFVLMAA